MSWKSCHGLFWEPIPPHKHPSDVYGCFIFFDWVEHHFGKPPRMLYAHRAGFSECRNFSFFSGYFGEHLKALYELLFLGFAISFVMSMAHIPIVVQAKHIYIIISRISI